MIKGAIKMMNHYEMRILAKKIVAKASDQGMSRAAEDRYITDQITNHKDHDDVFDDLNVWVWGMVEDQRATV